MEEVLRMRCGCSWITLSVVQPLNKALIVISHSSRRWNKFSSMYK